MESVDELSVLELFTGIGGMRVAMKESSQNFRVVGSYEINPLALTVYQHNFGERRTSEQNIMGMEVRTLEDLKPDILLMSPPCQPFTRQGLKRDVEDTRCSPFLHILSLLSDAKVIPKVILLENVAGFESSLTHRKLINVLDSRGYVYQEFLLTPSQLGIPNSRLRYYLIARLDSNSFCFETSKEIRSAFPVCTCYHSKCSIQEEQCNCCGKIIRPGVARIIRSRFSKWHIPSFHPETHSLEKFELNLSQFLDTLDDLEPYFVKKKDLKYAKVFDIVEPSSRGSCCFTRAYGYYAQGTGSLVHHNQAVDMHDIFKSVQLLDFTDPRYEELISSLQLRYFTPREVLRLMCFPDSFGFPSSFSTRQAYKMLGNSINVLVVAILLILALEKS